jgi:hypothetical protein
MAKTDLTAERLRQLVHYDTATGAFTRAIRSGQKVRVGDSAGHNTCRGYLAFSVDSHPFLAHRLAWLYVHGEWPAGQIDHINGVKTDNRLANLRVVTPMMNMQNWRKPPKRNKSGLLGVSSDKHGKKWRAQISANGKRVNLGVFDTPEEAHQAYLMAKRELHAGCTL